MTVSTPTVEDDTIAIDNQSVAIADSAQRDIADESLGQGNVFEIAWYRLRTANWASIAVSFGSSCVLEYGIDYLLKREINEMRPDRTSNNSMPSRHSSTAYGWGCTISYFLVPYSPWWGIGCHVASNAVGFQRVMSRNHYPGDVMAGAAVGIASDLMGTVISNWIFGSDPWYQDWRNCPNAFTRIVSVSTGASFPLQETYGDYVLGTALSSTLNATFPISHAWGCNLAYTLTSAPVKGPNYYNEPLNSMSLTVGAAWHRQCGTGPLAVDATLGAGYKQNLRIKDVDVSAGTPTAEAQLRLTMMLTRNYSVGLEGGYSISRLRIGDCARALSAFNVGFVTRAHF